MRAVRMLMVGLVLVVGACGGSNGEAETGPDGDSGDGSGILPTDFSVSDLPDEFPDSLVPPDILGGEFTDITGLDSYAFESSRSYDDIVSFYTSALGEPSFNDGDADGRLATWTNHGDWAVSVIDTQPTSIGVVAIAGE